MTLFAPAKPLIGLNAFALGSLTMMMNTLTMKKNNVNDADTGIRYPLPGMNVKDVTKH
jgi:hypothetical protein